MQPPSWHAGGGPGERAAAEAVLVNRAFAEVSLDDPSAAARLLDILEAASAQEGGWDLVWEVADRVAEDRFVRERSRQTWPGG